MYIVRRRFRELVFFLAQDDIESHTSVDLSIKEDSIRAQCNNGSWPSGKAPGFGPGIRRFESCRPSHKLKSKSTD